MRDPAPQPRRDGRRRSRGRACALVAALVTAGCVTTEVKSIPTTPGGPPAVDVAPAGRPMSAEEAVGADASAARLDNILTTLLLYYQLHHQLPSQLADLKPLAGAELDLTAPSGQPYLYVPGGMTALGGTKRIIVADPLPSPAGRRWCILMPPPPAGGGALSMEIIDLPETLFRQYGAS